MRKKLSFTYHKKLYSICIGILVCLLLAFIFRPPPKKNTYTVQKEDIISTLLINGTYSTASQVEVHSPANGIIAKLYVSDGTTVKKGDPLFHIESTATEEEKASAYATFLQAKTAVDVANATAYTLRSTMYTNWKKFTDLATNGTYQHGDGSPDDTNRLNAAEFQEAEDNWHAAETSYKNQQTVVTQAQAALRSATFSYNATQSITVNAPAAGTVVNFQKKVGDQVKNTQSLPILIISDLRNPVVIASVDQVNMPRIKLGQKASIVFDALPDQTFSGSVDSLDTVGTKTQGTTSYNVGIVVHDVSEDAKPNMTTSITLETLRKEGVIAIPNTAIIEKNEHMYVQKNGQDIGHLTEIKVGVKGLTKTEILQGLSTGDTIILPQ